VFAWGLQASSSAEQWARFLPIVSDNLSAELYNHMVADFNIDGPGKIEQAAAPPPTQPAQPAQPSPKPAASVDKPMPMPMSFMRNAHETIRMSIKELDERLTKGDEAGFQQLWGELQRCITVHMAVEEGKGGMFDLLDQHIDGIVDKAGLRDEHTRARPDVGRGGGIWRCGGAADRI
jgi:hypothetical protein